MVGTTLQTLRRGVGGLTGDLDILTATDAGSTSTFVDALNLAVENNSFAGRLGYFSGGTAGNLYRTVRIESNTKGTTQLTFTPTVPSSTATGDTLELYNRDGQGPTVGEIHNAINRCIAFVAESVLTEVLDTADTFDVDAPTLDVPSTWRRVIAVEYQDDLDDWHAIPPADLLADPVNRTMRIDHWPRVLADTRQVRLRGYTIAGALAADTDSTAVDAEWLIWEAASQVLLFLATKEKVAERRAADYRATSQYLHVQANAFRSKVPTARKGGGWAFPVTA